MASSLPAALDYLAEHIPALPAVQSAQAAFADGWPAVRGDRLIVIGVTPEEDDTGITCSYAELSRQEYEEIEVPSIITARRAGTDAASAARQDAFQLFDAIAALIRADRHLGGAIIPGRRAQIVRWTMDQTADARQAGEGRVCEIRWTLAWQHRA